MSKTIRQELGSVMIFNTTTFKHLKLFICAVFILSTSLHCGIEKPVPLVKGFQMSDSAHINNLQCFSHFDQNLNIYLSGQLSSEQIKKFWSCIDNFIYFFEKYVRGKNKNQYKLSEVMNFLSHYLNINGSDRMGETLWEISRSMLLSGGEERVGVPHITTRDLSQLKEVLVMLESVSIDLSPHMATLTGFIFSKQNTPLRLPSPHQRIQAITAMNQAAQRLVQWTQDKGGFLDFSVLRNKLTNARSQSSDFPIDLIAWVDLIGTIKDVFIGGEKGGIKKDEWPSLIQLGTTFIEVYTYKDLFLSSHHNFFQQQEGLNQLGATVEKVHQTLSEALLKKTGHTIPSSDIYKLVDKMKTVGLITSHSFSMDTIKVGWNLLIKKLLKKKETPKIEGFHISHLKLFQQEFADWFHTQNLINKGLINQNLKCSELLKYHNEVTQIVNCSTWPLRNDSRGHLSLSQDLLHSAWTLEDQSSLNWKRSLFRQLVRTYSDNPKDIQSGLTAEQLEQAYADLKPLIVASGMVAENSEAFQINTLIANLLAHPLNKSFDRASDNLNSQRVSQAAGVTYFHYLLSEVKRTQLLVSQLNHCLTPNSTEPLSFLPSCYWETLRIEFPNIFQSMPHLVHYVSQLEETTWQEISQYLSQLVQGPNPSHLTEEHIVKKFALISFIETITLMYDENFDQVLDAGETETFLSFFIPLIQQQLPIPLGSDEDVANIFTFLLKHGELPGLTTLDPLTLMRFNLWEKTPFHQRHLAIQRVHWLKGLSVLSTFFPLM